MAPARVVTAARIRLRDRMQELADSLENLPDEAVARLESSRVLDRLVTAVQALGGTSEVLRTGTISIRLDDLAKRVLHAVRRR